MENINTVPRSHTTDLENPENQNHDSPPTNPNNIEEEEDSNFMCAICIEPVLSYNKFQNQDKCVHPFCVDCVAKYIRQKVNYNPSPDIICPGSNCTELLDPLSCKTMISRNLFGKWCDKLCESAIVGVDKCYCPHPTCSTLILNECGVLIGSSTCPNCKRLFCFKCKMPWHTDYQCADSAAVRDVNDVLFGTLSERQKWARCPACGHCVERTSGCSIITCRCRTEFCYNCGGKTIHAHRCLVCLPEVRPLPVTQRPEVRPLPITQRHVQPAGAGAGANVDTGRGRGPDDAWIGLFCILFLIAFLCIMVAYDIH